MSAPGRFVLRVRTPGAPDRWVAIGEGGRAARLTTFVEHAYAAGRESLEALSRKNAVQKIVQRNATFHVDEAP